MAGPGGREVGRVSVRVLPDTSSFGTSLQKYLERVERSLRVELPVSLSAPDVARTEAELEALSRDRKVELKVDVDKSIVDSIGKSLGGLGGGGKGGIPGGLSMGSISGMAAALPALATILAGLPALLVALLAPIATIAVGFDGIRRAAQQLATPFKALQALVSGVFEKGLTPVFAKLADIMPTLGVGFAKIAAALITIADVVVTKLTSNGGLATIGAIFSNLASTFTILAPAMGPFIDALLLLMETGTAAFLKFAPLLTFVITKFSELLARLDEMGMLQPAFDGLALAIVGVVAAFGAFILIGVAIQSALRRVVVAIASVVVFLAGLPGRISGALSSLGGIMSGIFSRAMALATTAVATGIGKMLSLVRGLPGKMLSALKSLPGFLKRAGIWAIEGLIAGIQSGVGRLLSLARSIAGRVASTLSRALRINSPSKVMIGIGSSITEGLAKGVTDGGGEVEAAVLKIAGNVGAVSMSAAPAASFLADTAGAQSARSGQAELANALTKGVIKGVMLGLAGSTFRSDARGNIKLILNGA